MYQTILFDLDGTLTDPKEGITKCVQCGLRAAEIVVDDLDQLTWFIGPPLLSSFRKYPGMDETRLPLAMQAFAERFQTKGLYENSLYPDTVTLLRALHAAGKRLALATAKPERYGVRILEHFGLRADRRDPNFSMMIEMAENSPLRVISLMQARRLPMHLTEGLICFANGQVWRGIRKMLERRPKSGGENHVSDHSV